MTSSFNVTRPTRQINVQNFGKDSVMSTQAKSLQKRGGSEISSPAAATRKSFYDLRSSGRNRDVGRRLKIATKSMSVVGGSLVAWQVYELASRLSDASGQQPSNLVNNSDVDAVIRITDDEPKYLYLPKGGFHHGEAAKDELTSLIRRRPWNLLRAATASSKDAAGRKQLHAALKELHGLAHGLTDGEMLQLAQASTFEMAVGLASRMSNPDSRFFLPPPPLPPSVTNSHIPSLFKVVLTSLPTDDIHDDCIKLFTTTALQEYVANADDETVRDVDLDHAFSRDTHHVFQAIPRTRYYTGSAAGESAFLEYCLQALLSHSVVESHCEQMLGTPMLPLLIRIVNEYATNPPIMSIVAKVVANMAVFPKTHAALFASGFVGILSEWKKQPNLLLSVPATRALSNLDQEHGGPTYSPGVYVLLEPEHQIKDGRGVDVIFLHGLLGGLFYTWRQADPNNSRGFGTELVSTADYSYCWPRDWLKDDRMNEEGVRVIGVDFDTCLSRWWGNSCPRDGFRSSLTERSGEIYRKLKSCGVGERPVVFVGHSMGGLIVKKMLVEASAANDADFVNKTKGIVFYSTPHKGSRAATLNLMSKMLFSPSTDVRELEADSPALCQLHQSFLDLVSQSEMKIVSFGETVATPYLGLDTTFVEQDSSDPGCGEYHPVSQNHMNICKPSAKDSVLYRKLLDVVKGAAAAAPAGI